LLSGAVRAADVADFEALRLNQLQYIGTHNSYHTRDLSKGKRGVAEWSYSHAPLDAQLDRGVRSFELDLHYRNGEFEVFHVPLLDEGTSCRRLADALGTVRRWSEAHPRHVPISILFEIKKEGPGLDRRIKHVDAAGFDRLDEVLRAGIPSERRLEPDRVRGESATLRAAIESTGWPVLAACRGKVFFILHDDGEQRDLYTRDHASLRGRAMFVRSSPERDDAATLVIDNPRAEEIPQLARAGFFIRTRADAGLNAAAPGQPARRDASLASGAHILSTDFPAGEPHAELGYVVEFAGAAGARVNPVSGPAALRGQVVPE
jgi:hypothetical protein